MKIIALLLLLIPTVTGAQAERHLNTPFTFSSVYTAAVSGRTTITNPDSLLFFNAPQKTRSKITIKWHDFLPLVSGAAYGTAETLVWHYDEFEKRFPNADASFWDPYQSWRRKYKNGDPAQGPAFPFSTTLLVPFTDGYHPLRGIDRNTWRLKLVIELGTYYRVFDWPYVLVRALVGAVSYGIGFHATYTFLFRD